MEHVLQILIGIFLAFSAVNFVVAQPPSATPKQPTPSSGRNTSNSTSPKMNLTPLIFESTPRSSSQFTSADVSSSPNASHTGAAVSDGMTNASEASMELTTHFTTGVSLAPNGTIANTETVSVGSQTIPPTFNRSNGSTPTLQTVTDTPPNTGIASSTGMTGTTEIYQTAHTGSTSNTTQNLGRTGSPFTQPTSPRATATSDTYSSGTMPETPRMTSSQVGTVSTVTDTLRTNTASEVTLISTPRTKIANTQTIEQDTPPMSSPADTWPPRTRLTTSGALTSENDIQTGGTSMTVAQTGETREQTLATPFTLEGATSDTQTHKVNTLPTSTGRNIQTTNSRTTGEIYGSTYNTMSKVTDTQTFKTFSHGPATDEISMTASQVSVQSTNPSPSIAQTPVTNANTYLAESNTPISTAQTLVTSDIDPQSSAVTTQSSETVSSRTTQQTHGHSNSHTSGTNPQMSLTTNQQTTDAATSGSSGTVNQTTEITGTSGTIPQTQLTTTIAKASVTTIQTSKNSQTRLTADTIASGTFKQTSAATELQSPVANEWVSVTDTQTSVTVTDVPTEISVSEVLDVTVATTSESVEVTTATGLTTSLKSSGQMAARPLATTMLSTGGDEVGEWLTWV